jgi:hypothetical protein
MQKLVVHKVGVMSLGKLVGVWGAILGVIIGVISAVVSAVGVVASNDFSVWGNILASVGIVLGWIIVYPLVMFLLGWLQGAIMAVVFNVVVSGSGGLDLEVEEAKLVTKK